MRRTHAEEQAELPARLEASIDRAAAEAAAAFPSIHLFDVGRRGFRIEELKGLADIASPKCPVRFEPGREIDAEAAQAEETALAGKVRIDVAKGEITVFVPLDKAETEGLKHCVKTPEARRQVEADEGGLFGNHSGHSLTVRPPARNGARESTRFS